MSGRPTAKSRRRSPRKPYPNELGYLEMPQAVHHHRSARAVMDAWRRIQQSITTGQVLRDLPSFTTRLTRALWDVTPSTVIHAVQTGDVAMFVSILIRLDQLDCSLVRAQRTIADRAPITRAKFVVGGLLDAAAQNLVKAGGEWPLPNL